jgi:hypothetical protein
VLELCKKAQGECDGLTPPSCGRGKRSVNTIVVKADRAKAISDMSENEMDVVASMDILDTLDETDLNRPSVSNELLSELNSGVNVFHPRNGLLSPADRTCMSNPAFGLLLALTVILFITSMVATTLLCYRVRTFEAKH